MIMITNTINKKLTKNKNIVPWYLGMVKETGHAAEQFLRSVANGQADHRAERDQQAAAALQRVNTSPDWQTDCRSTLLLFLSCVA